jgi:hypothetical protein
MKMKSALIVKRSSFRTGKRDESPTYNCVPVQQRIESPLENEEHCRMKLKEAEIQRQRQLKKLKNEIVQQPNLKVNLSNYTFTSDGKPLVIEGVKNLRPNVACLLNAAEKPSRGLRSAGLIKHRMQRR